MNPKQLRAIRENLETIDSLVAECEEGLSMIEGSCDLTQDELSEFVSIYDAVNSATGVEVLYSGIPHPHANEIKRGVEKFNGRKSELRAVVKSRLDRLRGNFEEEYSGLSRQKRLEKKDLEKLDSIAACYPKLKEAFERHSGSLFSAFFGKDPVLSYAEVKKELDKLEEGIGKVVERYMNLDVKSKKEFQELLDKLTRLSSKKKKTARNDALLERAYGNSEEEFIRELDFIVRKFSQYIEEESSLEAANESLRQKLEYLRGLSVAGESSNALKELDRIERQQQPIYSFGRTARFSVLLEENSALMEEARHIARERKDSLVGVILERVNDSYKFVEDVLSKSIDSEGYRTLIARAKQRLEAARADLDAVSVYRNIGQQNKKYQELAAAVDTRMSEVEAYRRDKTVGTRLQEKALDVEADRIELEKMKLTKRERIRRMELETAEAMQRANEGKQIRQESVYMPAPTPALPARDKNFCNLYCEVETLEGPEDSAVAGLGRIITERIGRWEDMLVAFTGYIKSGKLGAAEGGQNRKYLTELREILKKSIDNGTLTHYAETSPQVKKAADDALASIDGYIANCCEAAAAPTS